MKTDDFDLTIPFIGGEDDLKDKGAQVDVAYIGWPEEFPYAPEVKAWLGHDGLTLWCRFEVRETHVRVRALEDNGNVWEDSCVELFVGHPDGVRYYNFETNAGGTPLGALRRSAEDFVLFTPDELKRLTHRSSLPRVVADMRGDDGVAWNLTIGIPFESIGYEKGVIPAELRMNLYKCGDCTDRPHFLSWRPVIAPRPAFHLPQFFGRVRLQQPPVD